MADDDVGITRHGPGQPPTPPATPLGDGDSRPSKKRHRLVVVAAVVAIGAVATEVVVVVSLVGGGDDEAATSGGASTPETRNWFWEGEDLRGDPSPSGLDLENRTVERSLVSPARGFRA